MFGTVNRSGFKGEAYVEGFGVALSEGPSDQAVRDLKCGYPCRNCADSAFFSALAQSQYEFTGDEFHLCYGSCSPKSYIREQYDRCAAQFAESNHHSKTIALFDRHGECILKAYEERG